MMGLMSNVTSVLKSEALFTAPSGESLSVGSVCVCVHACMCLTHWKSCEAEKFVYEKSNLSADSITV